MKYERFEDLPVWQLAAQVGAEIFDWTTAAGFRGKGDLADQLQRAALSISNNIAEGFERGSTAELLAFLYYARGSAGEVRSMLAVIRRSSSLTSLADAAGELQPRFESISRQIRGWTNSLQNSDIQGQRHLNDDSRHRYQLQQRRSAFLASQEAFKATLEANLKQQAQQRREQGKPNPEQPGQSE